MTEPDEGFCGTVGCLAGHVALEHGFRLEKRHVPLEHGFRLEKRDYRSVVVGQKYMVLVHPDGRVLSLGSGRGSKTSLRDYVAKYLGLSDWEAERLFRGGNSLANLRYEVNHLVSQSDRSSESKSRLWHALARVESADRLGLWDQSEWIVPQDEVVKERR